MFRKIILAVLLLFICLTATFPQINSISIIGPAATGDWNTDTNLIQNEEDADIWNLVMELGGTAAGVTYMDFDRQANSLDEAVHSAIADINAAGFRVARVEIEADTLPLQQA